MIEPPQLYIFATLLIDSQTNKPVNGEAVSV